MSWSLVAPFVLAAVVAVTVSLMRPRLRPDVAAWSLTVLAGSTAVATIGAVAALSGGFVASRLSDLSVFHWCRGVLTSHNRVPAGVGIAASLLLLAMTASMLHTLNRRRAASMPVEGTLIESDTPIAFAVPGAYGGIVVSTGMLDCLDEYEQAAMLAHERAHLRRHHHRFLRIAELSSAAMPLLHPLAGQIRYATERWADEDAARSLGDRRVVASAIARASLAGHVAPAAATSSVMPFVGNSVVDRVDALMHPPQPRHAQRCMSMGFRLVTTGLCAGGAVVQLHHLAEFIRHVCHV